MSSICLPERSSDYEATGQEEIDLYNLGYLEPLPKYSSEYRFVETTQRLNRSYIFKKATSTDFSRIDLKSVAKGTFCQLNVIKNKSILVYDHENFAVHPVLKAKNAFASPYRKFKMEFPHPETKNQSYSKVTLYMPYVLNECTRITVAKKDRNHKTVSKTEYFWVKDSRTSWNLVTNKDNKSNATVAKYQDSDANACGCIGIIDFVSEKKLSQLEEKILSQSLCLILFQTDL